MYTSMWYFQRIVKNCIYKKTLNYIFEYEQLINFGNLGKSAFLSLLQ